MSEKFKTIARKTLKILLWIIGSVIGLFLLIILLLQVPAVQDFARGKAVTFLEDKIRTRVEVAKIEIALPKKIVLRGVYFEDQNRDTLLAGEKLAVDISLLKLLRNQLEINAVELEGITANVVRTKDSIYNFDYIIEAFASDKPKDTTATPMEISVDRIQLKKLAIRYSDAITKNNVRFRLNEFETRFKTFNLPGMEFDVPAIRLDGLKLMLDQGLVEKVAETSVQVADTISKRPDFKLNLGEIHLTNIDIGYDNAGTHLNTGVKFKKLLLAFNAIDIASQNIDVRELQLHQFRGNLRFSKFDQPPKTPNADTTAIKQQGWKINLANLRFKDVDFGFDNDNAIPQRFGIDYNHLAIKGMNVEAREIRYGSEVISGKIDQFTLREKSGLHLQKFTTDFFYGKKGAYLKNLDLQTPRTRLRDRIEIAYASPEKMGSDLANLVLDANLNDSHIGFADLLIFAPQLRNTNPFAANRNAELLIDTRIRGKVGNIRIDHLQLSGIGNTKLDAAGQIRGLPDADKAYFDITLKQFQTTAKDVTQFLPRGTLPLAVKIPLRLAANGYFRGTIKNFDTNLRLNSSDGAANIEATFDQSRKNAERYDAMVQLREFHIGRLIGNDSLGRVSLDAKAKGVGLNPKTASAQVAINLHKATFNRYNYRDLKIKADVNSGLFDITAGMNDPNLTFALDANGGLGGKKPHAQIRLNVDIADLQRLNLHAGPMKLRGNLDADIPEADLDHLNGEINLHHIQILADKDPIVLDSIKVTATSTADRNTLKVKSQFLRVNVDGKYTLTQLPAAIKNSIAAYYNTNPAARRVKTGPQKFSFDIAVIDDPMLFKLLPELKYLDPVTISGNYSTENDTIVLKGAIPRLTYGTQSISGGNINVEAAGEKLVYQIDLNGLEMGSLKLPFTTLRGEVADNVINYQLQIRDTSKKEQYAIAGTLKSSGKNTELSLSPEGLVLNYEPWQIPEDNLLRFGPGGLYANNLELRHENNLLRVQSASSQPNAPLNVTLQDFSIETLLNIISKDEPLATGKLNGTVELRNLQSKPVFVSDLDITGLQYMNQPVGDLSVKVNNRRGDAYSADVELSGNSNSVKITGDYYAAAQRFDLNLDMDRLNMETLQAFTNKQITEGKGFLSGNFTVRGTVENPDVDGALKFNDVEMRVTQLNSLFKNINEEVRVDATGLRFDRFTIADEKNNELIIDGKVLTSDFQKFGFDLTVNADNFRAVNSKAKDNDLYYGDLFLDAKLAVKGTPESPQISGNLRINEETKFSVVLPQSDPAIADREGIVEFVDEDNTLLRETEIIKNAMDKSDVRGMDVNVTIQIDKEATLSLVVDKGNGDYLNLKGEAELTGGIDPSGKTTLTGKYEFTEGAYEMTFNMLRRKFEIKPGSYIIWNGEPTAANVDITAIYNVEAAPIDLLDDQLGGVSQSVRNTYKQRIPFQTLLKMNGELLKPVITFDIVLPDKNYNVSTEIVNASRAKLDQLRQEPSELNKQVFALLLLNRFIGENPFASEAGSGGAEQLARQSVSKILSEQMNQIAGDIIKGVELNFDLESTEDFTSGQKQNRTDLNVGVSKRLLNDRLKVTVGSSFGLEGEEQQNRQANNIAGDISADYQLTPDGRYLVRAYRKNEYQVALQGQVVETGVSFVLTMDYNQFRELFHRTEEEKEMRRREKEQREREREEAKEEKEQLKNEEQKEQ